MALSQPTVKWSGEYVVANSTLNTDSALIADVISTADDVAKNLSTTTTSIISNLSVANITNTDAGVYESVTPNVNFFGVIPPTEPDYPSFDSFSKPEFQSIDLYLTYVSDFLNEVKKYLSVGSDGLTDNFRNNTYSLEDNRISFITDTSIIRIQENNSIFSFPVNDMSGCINKITQENDFEKLKIGRDRQIEMAVRIIEHAKYVTEQGSEIEKALMMYAPELAFEQSKMQSVQANAYSTAVNSVGLEIEAIVSLFKAQINAYSSEAKTQQTYYETLLHKDMSAIALNKSIASVQNIVSKIDLENQANKVSLKLNSDASVASVAAHGAAGAMAANHTTTSTSSKQSYNSNTRYDSAWTNEESYFDSYREITKK